MNPGPLPSSLVPAFLVGLGGAGGAIARHLLAQRASTPARATLTVNVLGSFALGVLTTSPVGGPVLLALAVGFCGAFTTFSSFAVETTDALVSSGPRSAVRHGALNLVGALAAVAVGFYIGTVGL